MIVSATINIVNYIGGVILKQVGVISAQVIDILGLNVSPDTPIFLSDSNIEHMQTVHESAYNRYGDLIEEIIAHPTYVGYKKGAIEYVKEVSEYVKVAVRVSSDNLYFARTLYTINPDKVERFVAKGTLFSLT